MYVPFKIKDVTIRSLCAGGDYTYDNKSVRDAIRANINADIIKQALIDETKSQEEWFQRTTEIGQEQKSLITGIESTVSTE